MSKINPFRITPKEYRSLDEEILDAVHKEAYDKNKLAIETAFASQGVEWILIAKSAGNIVRKGKGNTPSDEEISALENSLGYICFCYTRPVELIEEIATNY